MKTREIDVWFREDYFEIIDDPPTKNPDKFVKAKLIVPVEPEVVEFTTYVNDEMIGRQPIVVLGTTSETKKLIGKRWRVRCEEVVE